jgi:hypothetical protein
MSVLELFLKRNGIAVECSGSIATENGHARNAKRAHLQSDKFFARREEICETGLVEKKIERTGKNTRWRF